MEDEQVVSLLKEQFYLRLFEEGIPRIEKCLGLLSLQEVWYRPNEKTNSIGHLILHLCGNVTQWIGSGVGKTPDHRMRQLEFETNDHVSKDVLLQRLTSLKEIAEHAFADINTSKSLAEKRMVQGFDETVLSIIVHVIEHFSYHVGQIAWITKLMANQDLGFHAGLDLDAKSI